MKYHIDSYVVYKKWITAWLDVACLKTQVKYPLLNYNYSFQNISRQSASDVEEVGL